MKKVINIFKLSINKQVKDTFRFIWKEQSKHNHMFFSMLILLIISAALADVIAPYLFSILIDKFSNSESGLKIIDLAKLLGYSVIGWIACRYLSSICWKYMKRMMAFVRNKTIEQLENRIREIMFQKSMDFFNSRFAGAVTTKETKFISAYGSLFDELVYNVWTNVFRFIGTAVLLFFVAWQFGVVFIAYVIFYFTYTIKQSRHKFRYDTYASTKKSLMTGRIADLYTNIKTIKLFGTEEYEQQMFKKQNHRKFLAHMITWRLANIRDNTLTFCNDTLMIVVMLLSIWLWNQKIITTGVVVLVMLYSNQIRVYLHILGNSIKNSLFYYADTVEMMKYVMAEPSIQDAPNCLPVEEGRGEIEFRNVTFSYPNNNKVVFKDFSLKIPAGQKIGFVGHSGGGKTSLISILPRLYEISEGDILIDGQSIKELSQQEFRRKMSVVSQEPLLFNRPIGGMIAYDKHATQEQIETAAKLACAHEFIVELPKGYNTIVGERGVMLSGGQKQRVAIARVNLYPTPILILDEATSAMDADSEKQIQQAQLNLIEDRARTMLVIAHRLSTVMHLDRVVVIEQGKIIEDDTPQNLLEKKGRFYQLWRSQQNPENIKYQLQLLTEDERRKLFAETFTEQKANTEQNVVVS